MDICTRKICQQREYRQLFWQGVIDDTRIRTFFQRTISHFTTISSANNERKSKDRMWRTFSLQKKSIDLKPTYFHRDLLKGWNIIPECE
jgi:hypothetical protein